MKQSHQSAMAIAAAALCLIGVLLVSAADPASAQRRPGGSDGGYNKPSRGGGGGGGGLPNAGRMILKLAPGILNNLDNDDEPKRRPRRPRPSGKIDNDHEEIRRPAKKKPDLRPRRPAVVEDKPVRRPPVRLTAIPPLPVAPPMRLPPPPEPPALQSEAPVPMRRAALEAERPQSRQDEIVVLVRAEQPDSVATQLSQDFNLVLQETLSFALLGTSRVYRFSIPDNRPVETIVPGMANVAGVGFAVPNGYYYLQGEPAAAAYPMQYALPKMRVRDAQAEVSGRGMTVAVIDSGVDATHPSLKNADLTVIDAVNGGVEGADMHGTAITGIIAAGGDMLGVAPGARIVAVRAFAPERLGSPLVTTATTLARAVDVAFSRNARIFNMSFAGRREPLLIEIIEAAYAQGAVFVAAAGNEGPEAPPAYPAAHDKVIAITATDEADELYGHANRGGYVLAAAPGVNILAPVMGEGFDFLSGTSFAAAHVTGVIALMMERNPQLTAENVRRILVEAAQDLGEAGHDDEFGAGLTDAYGALMLAAEPQTASESAAR